MSSLDSGSRCDAINAMMDDYVDGLLSPLSEREVKSHLYGCEKCQKEVEQLFVISEELTKLKTIPEDCDNDMIKNRIKKAVAREGKWRKRRLHVRVRYLAASAIFIALGFVFFRTQLMPFEQTGDDVAFHSRGKRVYIDASNLPGDLTVIGGDVYVEGPISGSITSIDGKVTALVKERGFFAKTKELLKGMWYKIWR